MGMVGGLCCFCDFRDTIKSMSFVQCMFSCMLLCSIDLCACAYCAHLYVFALTRLVLCARSNRSSCAVQSDWPEHA